jgi:hypothetical protein
MQLKNGLQILLIIFSCTLIVNCKENGGDTPGGVTTTPLDPTDPATPPTPGVVVEAAGFNIKVAPTTGQSYYIHKSGDFSKGCTVANDATLLADKDISCYVETEELEGIFSGINMVLNVPSTVCTYVKHMPYFYFGRSYGDGPTAVTADFDVDGKFLSGTVTPPLLGQLSGAGVPLCVYDHTSDQGPNCCTGTYQITRTSNKGSTDPNKPETVTVETGVSWNGKAGNCAAGTGADTAPRGANSNMPLGVIIDNLNGTSVTYATGGGLLKPAQSVYYANYYTSTLPAALSGGSPYYEWTCLDDAFEIKSRIRVQIREWNAMSEFLLKSAGDPDSVGTESGWGTPFNDFQDWDDIMANGDYFPGLNTD